MVVFNSLSNQFEREYIYDTTGHAENSSSNTLLFFSDQSMLPHGINETSIEVTLRKNLMEFINGAEEMLCNQVFTGSC